MLPIYNNDVRDLFRIKSTTILNKFYFVFFLNFEFYILHFNSSKSLNIPDVKQFLVVPYPWLHHVGETRDQGNYPLQPEILFPPREVQRLQPKNAAHHLRNSHEFLPRVEYLFLAHYLGNHLDSVHQRMDDLWVEN